MARSRGRYRDWSGATRLLVGLVALSPWFVCVGTVGAGGGLIFTVNSTLDTGDATPDGACDSCTLREAIEEANASPSADEIRFNIGGGGAAAIQPSASLPLITDRVTIDGYSQGGAQPNTLALPTQGTNAVVNIVLDGTDTIDVGLKLRPGADGSLIKGLVIIRFEFEGIQLDDVDDVAIEGNFVGTNAAGTVAQPNGFQGVNLRQTIGPCDGVTVGGPQPAQRNLISGNDAQGIQLLGATNVVIQGNLVGTARNGTANLGNGIGVLLSNGAKNATIGGTAAEVANVVAFNDGDGVGVSSDAGKGNRILRNSIFANGDLGIDLEGDGVTANDNKDRDGGPNRLQNFPVLTSVAIDNGTTTIKGTLNSTPETKFTIQVFVNKPGSGFDEGQNFLGQKQFTTDARGKARFTFTTDADIDPVDCATATATDKKKRDTSEFSLCKLAVD